MEKEAQEMLPDALDTLLIVDDTELNRALLAEIFKGTYQIVEAENGQEGLEKLLAKKDEICAVLLDVIMPVMDGMEVLHRMKEMDLLERIPVFLITAEDSAAVVREAYELGVMDVINKPVIPYVVSRRVGSVIELFRARKRLDNMVECQRLEILRQANKIMELNRGLIEALSTAIEFRSCESGDHVQRIHDITKIMLERTRFGAGLTQEEIDSISLAAIMHDVGKISIPDAILNKPGRLTPEEFEIMKTHAVQGCEMLERIPQMHENEAFEYAYDIARHHHERWDGRGYPDGLKGDEISIWAQIVSLADVYDALVSKRVYKDAFDFQTAVQMIQEGKCGVFNPALLESFLEVEGEIRKLYAPGLAGEKQKGA